MATRPVIAGSNPFVNKVVILLSQQSQVSKTELNKISYND